MGDLNNDINDLKLDSQIFKDVQFILSGNVSKKVEELLCKGGAAKRNYISDFVTHVICGEDVDDTDVIDAEDIYEIPAVNSNWVKACVTLNRLVNTKPYRRSKNKLFASLTFCIAQVSKNDLTSLWSLITYYGGTVRLNLDTKCTHLICGEAKGTRYTMGLSLTSDKLSIITPDWVLDSIKTKSLCATETYHPRLLIPKKDPKITTSTESKNGLGSITGFDFEESLAKTEVPTQGAGSKLMETPKVAFDKLKQRLPWNSPADTTSQLQSPINTKAPTSIHNVNVSNAQQSNVNISSPNNVNIKYSTTNTNNQTMQIQHQRLVQQQQQQIRNNQQMSLNQIAVNQQSITKSNLNQQLNNSVQNQQNDNSWKPQVISHNMDGQISTTVNQLQGNPGQNQMGLQIHHKPVSTMNLNINNQVTQSGGQIIAQNPPQMGLTNQQQNILNNQQPIKIQQQIPNQHLINNQQNQIGQQNVNINTQQMSDLQNQQMLIQQQNKMVQQNSQLQINNQQLQMSQHNNMQHQMNNQHIIATQQTQQSPVNQQLMNQQPQQINQQNQQQLFKTQQTIQNQQLINQQTIQNPQMINIQQNQQQIINQQLINQNTLINSNQQMMNQQNVQIINQQQQSQPLTPNQQMLPQQNQQVINQQQNPQQVWQHQQFIQRPSIPGQRAIWQQQVTQPGQPQRQLIHLDAQTHAQLQQMDPQQRAQFVAQLQKQQRTLMQKQQALARTNGPRQIAVIRSQVPAGLTPQQQIQWVQQQQQAVVRPPPAQSAPCVVGGAPGLSPISQQPPPQFNIDPNTPNQQHLQQLHMQRQQQYQRLKQLQMQREQAQKQGNIPMVTNSIQRQPGTGQTFPDTDNSSSITQTANNTVVLGQQSVHGQDQSGQIQPGQQQTQAVVVNNKTKTALANMLSNRLQSGCNAVVVPGADQEPSAAGTLRLMTAQHNASLNPVAPRTPQELLVMQQRRAVALANGGTGLSNNSGVIPSALGNATPVMPVTPGIQQANGGQLKSGPPGFNNNNTRLQVQPPRPQFYGHNPNLKLPPDLFLLGCIFLIVEYDVTMPDRVSQWKRVISRHGGEVEHSYCARVTHVLCQTQRHGAVMQAIRDVKRCVTAYWLSDTIIKKQVCPPWQAIHLPAFGTQRPAYKHIISYSGFDVEERIRVREMIEETGAKLTGYLSKHNTILVCRRLEGRKYKYARERGINVVSAAWLSDVLLGNLGALHQPDNLKYQQYGVQGPFRLDYSLVPNLMAGWKSPINITQESHERVKRSLSPQSASPSSRNKKPRINSPTPTPPTQSHPHHLPTQPTPITNLPPHIDLGNVEVTCMNPPSLEDAPRVWFSQVSKELNEYQLIVKQLGGQIIQNATEATHLVLGRPQRTQKLLLSLIICRYIVKPEWLTESKLSNTFLPCQKYIVDDPEFQQKFKCDISKITRTPNRTELFRNKIFHLTNSVQPSRTMLRELIEISGGVVEKNRRSCVQIQELQNLNPGGYIIITALDDLHLVIDIVRSTKLGKCVCNAEFVMACIMTQEVDFEPYLVTIT